METILSLSRAAFFSVVLTISLYILSSASFADTFTVMNTNDAGAGSLRDAIDMANANGNGPAVVDDIVFALGVTGTIPLSAQMTITDDVTISGPGAGVITIDAQMNGRIFNIDDGLAPDIVVSISGLRFINGGGVVAGGAIENFEELSIDSCVFEDNAALDGGAICNNGGTINTITHSTFSQNMADFGGAIYNDGPITTITHSTFSGNMADFGGAIFNSLNDTIGEITHSTFTGNMANTSDGAIHNASSATITEITHSTFDGNIGQSSNGAIGNFGTITAITNSTFRGNMAFFASTGAIRNIGTMNISFTTIANNDGVSLGGGINNSGTLNIKNSIVGDNTAAAGGNCSGAVTASGVNLDTDGSCSGFTTVTSAALNLDPAGLQDNGGPTQTIALISPSAAIDAVTDCTDLQVVPAPVTIDQRFFPRPFGAMCDVGAFEAQPTGKLTIVKETDPPGGMDFEFLGTGFPDGCGLADTFFLDDMEMDMCILPLGMYTVEEFPPPGILPTIMCDEPPSAQTFTGVTVDIADTDDVTCTFTNLQAAEVKITKLSIPPGGTGFEFTSTGFENFPPCDITPAFTLDNQEMASCLVLEDDFTITEAIPAGQVLNVFCEELPTIFNIDIDTDNSTGTLGFTIADLNESVDCLFINSPANTVVRVMDEPPGANCEFGGTKIETGLDTNQNGMLDPGEQIIDTSFVCNGGPGALVRVTPEPPGNNCAFGGQKIETGQDDNSDGVLQNGEIDDTTFVCNGAPGVDTLVTVTPEPAGANCAFGGQRIDTGADDNMNGVLDPEEIDNTFFVCNGAAGPPGPPGEDGEDGGDGTDTLTDFNLLPEGDEDCPEGGVRVDSGPDLNGNGVLDADEITDTVFICNGEDGSNGGCGGNTLAGGGGVDGMSTLVELFVLAIVPFIVILGRRFTKRKAIKSLTK